MSQHHFICITNIVQGDRLRLVDKSSFEGTGVNAIHGVNMPITHEGFGMLTTPLTM